MTPRDSHAATGSGQEAAGALRRILAPRSIAVVGAGRRRGGPGHETIRALRDYGFPGRLHAVNGSGRPVCGVLAHRAVTDLPGPVDLLVVAVDTGDIADVLSDAGGLGVRGAVLLGTGPPGGDPWGDGRRREILRIARRHHIRLLGPGCLGVLNTDPRVRLNASLSPLRPPSGGLALAVRSGAVGITLLADAVREHCGISSLVSLGDAIDLSGGDLLDYWLDDPATRAVALSPDAFSDPAGFARAAWFLGRRKPVLAITGAADPVREKLLAEAGVIRTASVGETLDTARILVDQPLPGSNRMAIVGNAGGLTALAADRARTYGFDVVPLSCATRAQLPASAGPAGSGNPVDLGIDALPARIADAVETVAVSGETDVLLLVLVGTRATVLAAQLAALTPILDGHPRLTIAAISTGGTADVHRFGRTTVPIFREPEQALRALAHARDYAAWRRFPPARRPDPERGAIRRTVTTWSGPADPEYAPRAGRGASIQR
ncbi:CoA-binding protein [Actinoplanes sp. NPDC048967]|uniref:CoA-binding protein n=1 Tax=Actinoplanes sp. NPDC048967 TaxID=3155269 RepID=UPI0033D616C7